MRSWRGQGENTRHTLLTRGLKQLAYHLRSAFASFKAGGRMLSRGLEIT